MFTWQALVVDLNVVEVRTRLMQVERLVHDARFDNSHEARITSRARIVNRMFLVKVTVRHTERTRIRAGHICQRRIARVVAVNRAQYFYSIR